MYEKGTKCPICKMPCILKRHFIPCLETQGKIVRNTEFTKRRVLIDAAETYVCKSHPKKILNHKLLQDEENHFTMDDHDFFDVEIHVQNWDIKRTVKKEVAEELGKGEIERPEEQMSKMSKSEKELKRKEKDNLEFQREKKKKRIKKHKKD